MSFLLKLHSRNYPLKNEKLQAISKCLGKLKMLKDIRLYINTCQKITDKAFEQFQENVRKLKFLKSLDLDFDR